jgi:uncharacterized membrane protein
MFARWYALFVGFLLLVLGVAGLIAAGALTGTQTGLIAISLVWLVTAIVGLWMGFGVRNNDTLRWFAGIVGGLYFLWGIIQLFGATAAQTAGTLAVTASTAGLTLLLGAFGLGAAFMPTVYGYERTEPKAT